MEEVTIYKFQLEEIIDALRLTANIHDSRSGKTCFDRIVRKSEDYARNALDGNIDKKSKYIF